jgi:hypothetical protein
LVQVDTEKQAMSETLGSAAHLLIEIQMDSPVSFHLYFLEFAGNLSEFVFTVGKIIPGYHRSIGNQI